MRSHGAVPGIELAGLLALSVLNLGGNDAGRYRTGDVLGDLVARRPVTRSSRSTSITASRRRGRFAVLLEDAHKRRFDIVLCWALERLSREGMAATVGTLQQLAAAGVAFHSYTEPMLSADNEMVRDILLAVMASLAKQERVRHVERVKAGIARARELGTKIGKPIGRARIAAAQEKAIRQALAVGGKGIIKIARELEVGVGTVHRIAREGRAGMPVKGFQGPIWR
jgi:DNA invertase Pin-like site-specific DNA recombinase